MPGRDEPRSARRSVARSRIVGVTAIVATLLGTPSAIAAPPQSPEEVGGELRPAKDRFDDARRVADALLFVPRALVEVVVMMSSATVSFLEDQQVVPRARALMRSEDGRIRATPTLSIVSGLRPEVGARLTAVEGPLASMVRASVVDRDAYLSETRVVLSLGEKQLYVEAFEQRSDGLAFVGVGPVPRDDRRNAFAPGHEGATATFAELRERVIAGVSARFQEDTELLLSGSFQHRAVTDPRVASPDTLATTFLPGSVPGAYARSDRFYVESALRRDTRAVRGPPAAGLLVEVYGGASEDARGLFSPALHAGGTFSLFVPVVRSTTIINPRVSLEIIDPLGDKGLPFRELSHAAGFRGVDARVDRVAALASVDYRWQLIPFVAARLFVDTTTVAPGFFSLGVDHLAWAVGGGIDLHSRTTELGRLGVSYSPQAVQLILTFGLAGPGFGDRQHR